MPTTHHPIPDEAPGELSPQARADKLRGVLAERWEREWHRPVSLLSLDDVPPPVQLDARAMLDILVSTAGALGWCPITSRLDDHTIELRVDKLLPIAEPLDDDDRGPGMSPCVGCGGHHFKAEQYASCAKMPRRR